MAANWVGVGDGATEVCINDIFDAASQEKFTANTMRNSSLADQIQVWDPSRQGFTTYYYCSNPQNTTLATAWCVLGSRTPTTDTINLAEGFWFLRYADGAVDATLCGQVSAAASVSLTFGGNDAGSFYSLFGSGYPMDMPLNDPSLTWDGSVANTMRNSSLADQIQVWDPSRQGFTTYYYCSNPQNTTLATAWCVLGSRTPTTDAIPAGAAAWYLRYGTSSMTASQAKPY